EASPPRRRWLRGTPPATRSTSVCSGSARCPLPAAVITALRTFISTATIAGGEPSRNKRGGRVYQRQTAAGPKSAPLPRVGPAPYRFRESRDWHYHRSSAMGDFIEFSDALVHHRAGRLAQAEAVFRRL